MKTKPSESMIAFVAILAFVMAILTSCGSKSGKRVSAKKHLVSRETRPSLNLDSMILADVLLRNSARIWCDTAMEILPAEVYADLDDAGSVKVINGLVNICEKQQSYHLERVDDGEQYKILEVSVLNTPHGHFFIKIWKTMQNKIYFVSLDRIQIRPNGKSLDVVDVVFDGDGDGILHPKGGADNACWPSPQRTSHEFRILTPEQHHYANTKYLQLTAFLVRILRDHENKKPVI